MQWAWLMESVTECIIAEFFSCTQHATFLFIRKRLFNMINDHPSVYELMADRKGRENNPGVDNSSKSRHSTKVPF